MPEEKRNNIFFNFFSLGIVQLITSLLQLIIIPYVIARIGIDGFGAVAIAQVVMFYLSAFTEYGFSQTATREISIYRSDRLMISKIFFRVIFSKIILCVLSFIILLLLFLFVPLFRQQSFLYITGFVFVIGQAVLINWFFTGVEKMQVMAIITLIARLIFVVLVLLFIKSKGDNVLYLFFLGAGNFVMGLISIFLMIRKYKLLFIKPGASDIKEELIKGWQVTATNLSNNLCQYSNIFILRIFTNDLVTGYYSVAERVFLTLRQMLGVFSQTVYPQVCLVVAEGREAIASYFRKIYFPFFALLVACSMLLFFLAPWVIYFFIHQENGNSTGVLRIFALVLVIACLNIPATVVLLATEQRQSYFKVYAAGVVINVLLNLLLAYFFQSTGTAIAILITELFITTGLTRELLRLDVINKRPLFPEADKR